MKLMWFEDTLYLQIIWAEKADVCRLLQIKLVNIKPSIELFILFLTCEVTKMQQDDEYTEFKERYDNNRDEDANLSKETLTSFSSHPTGLITRVRLRFGRYK